jgi:hypothetical protein
MLFTQHLELAPLRGRPRGVVRCPFHDDHQPSLSVDLDLGVFYCHGCGAQGGGLRFAALVGEARPAGDRPSPYESPLQEARRRVARLERARAQHLEEWAPYWAASDHVRRCLNAADAAHRMATQLGADDPRTWSLLDQAARVQTEAFAIEAELDAILADGRIG